jgi:signal transduction histidine kinase
LTTFFDPGLDRNAIERLALAYSVHAEGAGFRRAHLLAWNPDRASFEGRLSWSPMPEARTLEEALVGARWLASEGADSDATRLLRALRFELDDLERAMRQAWARGRAGVLLPEEGPQPWRRAARVGVIPLRHGARLHGMIVGEWTGRAGKDRLARLEAVRELIQASLASHAAAELARDTEARAAALASLARATVSPLNLAEATHLAVKLAAEGTFARGAALWRVSVTGDERKIEGATSYGPAAVRDRIAQGLQGMALACAADLKTRMVERPCDATEIPAEVGIQLSSVVMVPIAAHGQACGALAVYDRLAQHPSDGSQFAVDDARFLGALADQFALAARVAHGDEARREGERARRDLVKQLGTSERWAALGELSARLAREARNPIASISAFARRVHRNLSEDDPNRDYLEVVIREAARLEQTLTTQLPAVEVEPPRLRLESVNGLLQSVLRQSGEQLVRRRVRLLKRLSNEVPQLLLDVTRMSAAFRNVLEHVLERVNPGGRVRVETRRVQHFVVIEIAHDGRIDPGQLLDDLFVPFHLQGGHEAGLGMARQIVLEHGGEVRARSAGEWSTVFLLSLPIRDNADRRQTANDRRVTRSDRRHRSPSTSSA